MLNATRERHAARLCVMIETSSTLEREGDCRRDLFPWACGGNFGW
jgi:hypothetical protein